MPIEATGSLLVVLKATLLGLGFLKGNTLEIATMKKIFVALLIFFVTPVGMAEDTWPEELAPLQKLVDQEDAFVDALRAFDKEQGTLADAEFAKALAGQQEQKHRNEGRELVRAARARVALLRTAYDLALTRYPENPRLINYSGELLYDREQNEVEGLACWKKALELKPDLAAAHNNMALHLVKWGEYEAGFKALDRALELEPDHIDFLYNAVQIYMIHYPQLQEVYGWDKAKIYKSAMAYSEKAARLSPKDYHLVSDYAGNFFHCDKFGVEADWKAASKAWQQARGLAKNDDIRFHTWLYEARAWIRGGKPAKAEKCIDQALILIPGNRVAKDLLAVIKGEKRASSSRRNR